MLLEEVLILGATAANEDKVVSATDGNTVVICILSPVTTLDERDVDPTTSGHSSTLDFRSDKLVTHRLTKVGSETSCDWDNCEKTGVDALKGRPMMGSKLYSAGGPIAGKLAGTGS